MNSGKSSKHWSKQTINTAVCTAFYNCLKRDIKESKTKIYPCYTTTSSNATRATRDLLRSFKFEEFNYTYTSEIDTLEAMNNYFVN